MSSNEDHSKTNYDPLIERIQLLEKRLVKVESLLRLEWVGDQEDVKSLDVAEETYTAENAESKIVEYGLAWLGSIVFSLGIVFLMAYLAGMGYLGLSRVAAYFATGVLFLFSFFLRKSFPILTNVLQVCTTILLYYITVRLHFFSTEPIISQMGIVIILLFIIIALQLYHALKVNSQLQATLAILFCVAAAIFSDSAYITFGILTLISLTTLILFNHRLWWKIQIFSIFVVYFTHLMWLFGNPVMGHEFGVVQEPQNNIYFLLGYAIIFIMSIFIPKDKLESNTSLISITIWNALWFSLLMLVIIPSYYVDDYILIFMGIAVFCLAFAIILKIKAVRMFAPATYACFGFMGMSIAIYGFAGLPNAYFLLVLQSFLVVSMALWFRSKIIVVANAFLFIFILIAYFITSESIDSVNFALAFTALATARILNWKKERLTLRGEIYRNMYLLVGCFMVLYSLNQVLPSNYVTLAWTATAFIFFIFSIILKKIKYRYLSILTIVITAGHLFFVDLGQMEIGYRVIAFIAFAVISLGLSLYYTKRIRKK